MGLTVSDIRKIYYSECIHRGMTHEEVLELIPEKNRDQFLEDIQKSDIGSHFGIKDRWFYAVLIGAFVVMVLSIIIAVW